MTSHYTRSKAHRPSASILEEGDVELTGAAPGAATSSAVDISVRSTAEAVGEPGSMAAEPAWPVCAPSILLQRDCFPLRADSVHQSPRVLLKWGLHWDTPAVLQARLKLVH